MTDGLTLSLFEFWEDVPVAQGEGSLVNTRPIASPCDNVLEAGLPCALRDVLGEAPRTGFSSTIKPLACVPVPSSATQTPDSAVEAPVCKDDEGWTRWKRAADILAHIAIRAASSSLSSSAPTQ